MVIVAQGSARVSEFQLPFSRKAFRRFISQPCSVYGLEAVRDRRLFTIAHNGGQRLPLNGKDFLQEVYCASAGP
jgi:hypothetical protein